MNERGFAVAELSVFLSAGLDICVMYFVVFQRVVCCMVLFFPVLLCCVYYSRFHCLWWDFKSFFSFL